MGTLGEPKATEKGLQRRSPPGIEPWALNQFLYYVTNSVIPDPEDLYSSGTRWHFDRLHSMARKESVKDMSWPAHSMRRPFSKGDG
jgi:hypothetical protein